MKLPNFAELELEFESASIEHPNRIVFELPIQDNRKVYLRQDLDCEGGIVLADTRKFLSLWQNMRFKQEPQLSFGKEKDWRSDYKFHHAERGFSFGRRNPVPLAEVVFSQYVINEPIYVRSYLFFKKVVGYTQRIEYESSFQDGITRSIWLFANGADYFPIFLRSEQKLKEMVIHTGISRNSYYLIKELKQYIVE